MFGDASPTPLDLRFRLFGFAVRVSPWFWLTMFLIGGPTYAHPVYGPLASVVWMLCGFFSILVHELGHGFAARAFRCPGEITFGMCCGGLSYLDGPPPSGWRRLTVVLAGPGAGFALLLLLFVTQLSTDWANKHSMLGLIFGYLTMQCLFWNMLNLLPIFPLDGGNAFREIAYILGIRKPDALMHTVSIAVAGILVVIGILGRGSPDHPLIPRFPFIYINIEDELTLAWVPFIPGVFMIVWYGLLAVMNWQMLQSMQRTQRGWDDDDSDAPPWRR